MKLYGENLDVVDQDKEFKLFDLLQRVTDAQ